MINTVEKIVISETTTSYRIRVDNVDVKETLDERYRRHYDALESKEEKPAPQVDQSEQK